MFGPVGTAGSARRRRRGRRRIRRQRKPVESSSHVQPPREAVDAAVEQRRAPRRSRRRRPAGGCCASVVCVIAICLPSGENDARERSGRRQRQLALGAGRDVLQRQADGAAEHARAVRPRIRRARRRARGTARRLPRSSACSRRCARSSIVRSGDTDTRRQRLGVHDVRDDLRRHLVAGLAPAPAPAETRRGARRRRGHDSEEQGLAHGHPPG